MKDKSKTFKKLISLIMAQVFLLTAIVYPAEPKSLSYNINNTYSINMPHLRPMVGKGTEKVYEAMPSNNELAREQVSLRIKSLKHKKHSELLDRIVENIITLRGKWDKDPDFFLTFHDNEGRDAIDKVLKYMRINPNSFFGYGDMCKAGAVNRTFIRKLVDHFFPIVINAADIIAQKYGGFAYRITGDEIGLYLPPTLSPKEADFIRLEIQATLDNFMVERFGFVKIKGIATDNLEEIDEANKVLRDDGFSGLYRDKDGIFMVFDRHKFNAGDLEKDCVLAVEDANKKLMVKNIKKQSKPEKIPSIRVSFGIVRACKSSEDMYKNFTKSKRHAQHILDITKKDKSLKLHGATADFLREQDKFEEAMESAEVRMLKKREIMHVVNLYKEEGLDISSKYIETYYPVIQRDYLMEVVQKLVFTIVGTTVIVRGPPDSFYIATRGEKGGDFIFLMKCVFYYNPLGELKKKVEKAIEKKFYTADDLRESGIWKQWLGFKMISEFFSHDIANSVILTETDTVNKNFDIVVLDTTNKQLMILADRITTKVKQEIEPEVNVRVILSGVMLELDNLGDPFLEDGEGRIARVLDDLEYIEFVDRGVTILETENGNLVKVYERNRKSSRLFASARSRHRKKTRKKFSKILRKSYSEPALSKKDFESISAKAPKVIKNINLILNSDVPVKKKNKLKKPPVDI